jgi:hypothetical protein
LGISAITAAVMYAWEHFEGFRKTVFGVWEVIKQFVSSGMQLLAAFGEVLKGVFTLNPDMIAKGLTDSLAVVRNAGKDIKDAWAKGQNEGAVSFLDSQSETQGLKKLIPPKKDGKLTTNAPVKPNGEGGEIKSKATGQKSVTIHIAINGGLIHGDFKVVTNKLSEGLGKAKDMVAEALTGAINDSQIIAAY